ncbi:hypothetical protein [uncultured Psychroserpens sp.]|uniref:hypothetical protein n=1 Tax=uncultured Psychroserpens sp. TaxID=255436 RepID=UPI0026239EA8|nr:hypothetical protein [uncultured Psychroserpens sp.]
MKAIRHYLVPVLLLILIGLESCGPVIISSRPAHPTPPWFYPNRVVNVRYIYFPDHMIYYDLSLRNYIYFDNGVWLSVNVLPNRFNTINLRRSRQIRINNYFGDNIREYHRDSRTKSQGRRTTINERTNRN